MNADLVREELISLLQFPRSLVQEELHDREMDCPHCLRFAKNDSECVMCDRSDECHWLWENDEFNALEKRPLSQLMEALDYALCYVQGEVVSWGHRWRECPCDACAWVNAAQQVYDRLHADAVRH